MSTQGNGDSQQPRRGLAEVPGHSQHLAQPQKTNNGPTPAETNEDLGCMKCTVCMENLLRPSEVAMGEEEGVAAALGTIDPHEI